jgi:hypothetical protein
LPVFNPDEPPVVDDDNDDGGDDSIALVVEAGFDSCTMGERYMDMGNGANDNGANGSGATTELYAGPVHGVMVIDMLMDMLIDMDQ